MKMGSECHIDQKYIDVQPKEDMISPEKQSRTWHITSRPICYKPKMAPNCGLLLFHVSICPETEKLESWKSHQMPRNKGGPISCIALIKVDWKSPLELLNARKC